MICLGFTNPENSDIELVKGGKDIDVVIDNLQEYIDYVLHSTFQATITMQIAAFKKGFNSILPIESMRNFRSTTDELETLICGQSAGNDAEWTDANFLKTVISPDHGYSKTSREYNDFIQYITELEKADRKIFLNFVTGSNRLPPGGFAELEPRMTVN